MKDVKINGLVLRFDWGTMEHMGEASGLDAANPLEGLPVSQQAYCILYGALARVDEMHERPVTYSLTKCKSLIKEFSGAQVKKLIESYNISMMLDVEDDELKDAEETAPGNWEERKKK
jgi:hypothetical protein